MPRESQPQLFFLTGRLKWTGIPLEWQKPDQEVEYEAQIKSSDFIVDSDLQGFNLADSATVKQDVGDLRTFLLEPYFRSNQRAKHYQNDYFRQQWILVLGTFITALITTVTIIFSPATSVTPTVSAESATGAASEATAPGGAQTPSAPTLTTSDAVRVAGVITAIVTFVTTIVTYLSQTQRPQYNWYLWRTVTEELRRHYFLYLAHLPPYHVPDSAEILELNVAQIETQQTQQDKQATTPEDTAPREQHTEGDAEALTKLYRAKRVQVQKDFYESRISEYQKNANFIAVSGVVLVAMATLLSTINASIGSQVVILIIGLLPVTAALLATFEKIYGWVRQSTLYEDAFKRLRIDDTIPPVGGRKPARLFADVLMDYVSSVENTLRSEMNQWGQNVLKDGSNVPSLSAQETLEMALAKSTLPSQQMDEIRRIFGENSPT